MRTTFEDWYMGEYPDGLPKEWVDLLRKGWDARYRTLTYNDL